MFHNFLNIPQVVFQLQVAYKTFHISSFLLTTRMVYDFGPVCLSVCLSVRW